MLKFSGFEQIQGVVCIILSHKAHNGLNRGGKKKKKKEFELQELK